MKKTILLLIFLSTILNVDAQKLKPYILAGYSTSSISDVEKTVKTNLKANGFKILGSYNPMETKSRKTIAVTNANLQSAVKKVGGFKGLALVQRVSLTLEDGKILVSYTNPEYWGRAYFTDKWEKVSSDYKNLASSFKTALSGFEGEKFKEFGSKKGLSYNKLKKYHYMMGMPYFDDNISLKTFQNYKEAISTIDKNLKAGVNNVVKVYSTTIDSKEIALYGIGLTGKEGEKNFMNKIDVSDPKHTAFLPYELLVVGNKAYMLHGRYRIALSFPDLSMGQFMKIVSTPGYIKDKFTEVCN